ncbi:MAG: Gfo/Idh/MocA family oxidoreductase [Bacteroidetes bacterium]|jgi:myo-inositol 2-dehydrogenase / D-chiro-inositol 1-dehydrogenase|nr:Gfo/Idh/MocA family oxidoreductase [Bacteroidota bacterium]
MEGSKSVSRRKFLGAAGAIGAVGSLSIGSVLTSCSADKKGKNVAAIDKLDQAPDGKLLKAGLVGCGNRGTGAAFNFLDAGPNLQIVALADVFDDQLQMCRQKLKKQKQVDISDNRCYTGFDGFKKLIESDVDIVLLATPPHFRPEHLEACVQAKKHVFMEKPAAVDPVGIRSIIGSAKKAEAIGLCIVAGTQRRHERNYLETRRQVQMGAIGNPIAANAYWLQNHVWYKSRQEGWSDMEYMVRNWNNFRWLCGDHFLDTHVHNIDIINWFTGKQPISALGGGARHRRLTGDQWDFFSVDFYYGEGLHSHSMSRQIDNCANATAEHLIGTEGYTNCKDTIYNPDGSIMWQYEYPEDANGNPTTTVSVSPYVQEHIDLITAIRNHEPINEAEQLALSTMTAIMGREAAYTGQLLNWDAMMKSNMRMGPKEYVMGPVDMEIKTPVPGTAHGGN